MKAMSSGCMSSKMIKFSKMFKFFELLN
jgi:hypothetical protein